MFSTKTDQNHLSQKFVLTASEKRKYRECNPIPRVPYIPPPLPEDAKKILLILDLDETLIHGSYCMPPRYDFTFELRLPLSKRVMEVFVLVRPFLQEFLEYAHRWFELMAYTASLPIYADRILDRIDPKRYIKHRLYRHHCGFYKEYYIKDLEFLGRPLSRILLVDNHPASYMVQRDNGIPIYSYLGQPKDAGLKNLISFLDDIRDDVSPIPKAKQYAILWRQKLQTFLENLRDSENSV